MTIDLKKRVELARSVLEAQKDPFITKPYAPMPSKTKNKYSPIEHNGNVVGFLLGFKDRHDGTPRAMPYVNSTHRGKGLALGALSEFFKDKKTGKAQIEDANIASIKAHERLGFVKGHRVDNESHMYFMKKMATLLGEIL